MLSFKERDEERRYRDVLALEGDATGWLEALLGFLGDPSWRVRRAALEVVRERRDSTELVDKLVEALRSEVNVGLRAVCAEALGFLGPTALPGLTRGLKSEDPHFRKFIVEVLGRIIHPDAETMLAKTIDDPDVNVATAAVESLVAIGGPGVGTLLTEHLAKSAGDVQRGAYLLHGLIALGVSVSEELVRPALSERAVRPLAYVLLGRVSGSWAAEELARGLEGPRRVREGAIRGLWETTHRGSQPSLTDGQWKEVEKGLASSEPLVAQAAVGLLCQGSNPRSIAVVLEAVATLPDLHGAIDLLHANGAMLKSPLLAGLGSLGPEALLLAFEILDGVATGADSAVCLDAARGIDQRVAEIALRILGRVGEAETAKVVFTLVKSGGGAPNHPATLALAQIADRFPREVTQMVRADCESGGLNPAWLRVLSAAGRYEDLAILLKALRHPDEEIREAALRGVSRFREHIQPDDVLFAIGDPVARVRAVAAYTVSVLKDVAVVEAALRDALSDPNVWVVAEAARGLGRIGSAGAQRALVECLERQSAVVILAALESLMELRPGGVAPLLRPLLAHFDPEVVRTAVRASAALAPEQAEEVLQPLVEHADWSVRLTALGELARRGLVPDRALLTRRWALESEGLVRDLVKNLLWGVGSVARMEPISPGLVDTGRPA